MVERPLKNIQLEIGIVNSYKNFMYLGGIAIQKRDSIFFGKSTNKYPSLHRRIH